MQQWRRHGLDVYRVRVEAMSGNGTIDVVPVQSKVMPSITDQATKHQPFMPRGKDGAVMSLLFADVVGFSQLTDLELANFVPSCLGLVARLIEGETVSIPVHETWGRRSVSGNCRGGRCCRVRAQPASRPRQ